MAGLTRRLERKAIELDRSWRKVRRKGKEGRKCDGGKCHMKKRERKAGFTWESRPGKGCKIIVHITLVWE